MEKLTPEQEKLKANHGTPAQFAKAVRKACDGLMVTPEEAEQEIAAYEAEWNEAGR